MLDLVRAGAIAPVRRRCGARWRRAAHRVPPFDDMRSLYPEKMAESDAD